MEKKIPEGGDRILRNGAVAIACSWWKWKISCCACVASGSRCARERMTSRRIEEPVAGGIVLRLDDQLWNCGTSRGSNATSSGLVETLRFEDCVCCDWIVATGLLRLDCCDWIVATGLLRGVSGNQAGPSGSSVGRSPHP
ncbi:hypothetical protein F511_19430 [Dorcoceras hygrometricum]|uniref:Uncharacterized protein n=1 Tax=Dorcoceras hygrometricum TaxID=472368 RepID=A0A2Z7CP29_9LAMI|nr:hypothetical protein F511_19430 [Dorcoceras hygrometricum]